MSGGDVLLADTAGAEVASDIVLVLLRRLRLRMPHKVK